MSSPRPAENMDWDHVKVFLATIRSRSLRQAADQLGLSHPTARRHLSAFEEQLGLRLFDRRPDGLHATVEAEAIREAAEDVERAMNGLSRVAHAADDQLRGPVRVSFPDIFGVELLMPDFVEFADKWPQIDLHLDSDYALADLDKREADVAIRIMRKGKLPDDHLMGRLAATGHRAVYGRGEHWIGWEGGGQDASWIKDTPFPDLPVRGAMNNPWLQRSAAMQGMGLTLLPCFFADPYLERRSDPVPAYDIWVLVHPDLRANARLRVFRDAVVAALHQHKARLEGRAREN